MPTSDTRATRSHVVLSASEFVVLPIAFVLKQRLGTWSAEVRQRDFRSHRLSGHLEIVAVETDADRPTRASRKDRGRRPRSSPVAGVTVEAGLTVKTGAVSFAAWCLRTGPIAVVRKATADDLHQLDEVLARVL